MRADFHRVTRWLDRFPGGRETSESQRTALGEHLLDLCDEVRRDEREVHAARPTEPNAPIPMLLWCPKCGARHIDEGEFATRPHRTHTCQNPTCGLNWQPALVPTTGVQFLPGCQSATDNALVECPRGHSNVERLDAQIQGSVEDALRCLSCPASYVRVGGRWFEAPEAKP